MREAPSPGSARVLWERRSARNNAGGSSFFLFVPWTLFFFGLLAAVFLAGSVIPLARRADWWIRIFDFPRTQLAIIGLALCAALVFLDPMPPLLRGFLGLLLAGGIGLHVHRMLPYTPLRRVEVLSDGAAAEAPGNTQLRLLIANVRMRNRESSRLLALADRHQPDLFLAVETDAWWSRSLAGLHGAFPHRVEHPLENTYGMLLFSRLKLIRPEVRFLIEPDVPSIHADLELRDGTLVHLHCLHPRPPRVNQDTAERDAELVVLAKMIRDEKGPTVVSGDLNDVAWSYTTRLFRELSRLLDPRIGRGLFPTYPVAFPGCRFPLDHIFHSDDFRLGRLVRLPAIGSDHFPLLAELTYAPREDGNRRPEWPDREDRQEARRMLREASRER